MVRFENVGMRYGSGPEILHDISFRIESGSFYFVTGPSGSGKSSLLKLLYLAHRPSRGLINLFGRDLALLPRNRLPALRRRIGVVFQDFRLLNHLSCYENVALPLRLTQGRESEYREDVVELLNWVGLGDRLNVRPPFLSGGEQQRVAIARAVVGKPDLLLADEPTGSVDSDIARRLISLFVQLNRLGTTVVIGTHDRSLVRRVGAPELRLTEGTVRLHGAGIQVAEEESSDAAPREQAEG